MTTKPEDLPFATQPPNPGPKTQHEQSVAGEEDPGSALDESTPAPDRTTQTGSAESLGHEWANKRLGDVLGEKPSDG
ncbi:hypothetical protein [Acidovorax sp. NCPPB 3576]|uniref:hypothetical protein n=1 Tax=Acidovorax sp. NCPPB 3576 TaxID=2940488 RepID=UPI00234B45F2|nr:hypothetical protein [Acidovorax sp. NCPPB 3576]WCM86679.1 hypothetical protein M5C98_14965 [Acidovorax sp. NCPPB 3576]